MRIGTCFDLPVVIIDPVGFPLSAKAIRQTALDYGGQVEVARFPSFDAYLNAARAAGRQLHLLTTRATASLYDHQPSDRDDFLFGQESSGAPAPVHEVADSRLRIPIAGRSLNLAISAAVVASEVRRQMGF